MILEHLVIYHFLIESHFRTLVSKWPALLVFYKVCVSFWSLMYLAPPISRRHKFVQLAVLMVILLTLRTRKHEENTSPANQFWSEHIQQLSQNEQPEMRKNVILNINYLSLTFARFIRRLLLHLLLFTKYNQCEVAFKYLSGFPKEKYCFALVN